MIPICQKCNSGNCKICKEEIDLDIDSYFSRIVYEYDKFNSQTYLIQSIMPIRQYRVYFCTGCIVHKGFVSMKGTYKIPELEQQLRKETIEQLMKYCATLESINCKNVFWELDNGFDVTIQKNIKLIELQ